MPLGNTNQRDHPPWPPLQYTPSHDGTPWWPHTQTHGYAPEMHQHICETAPYHPPLKMLVEPWTHYIVAQICSQEQVGDCTQFTSSWENAKRASNMVWNIYISALQIAKADHWQQWLEEANKRDVWIAGKYVKKTPLWQCMALHPHTTDQRDGWMDSNRILYRCS